jgi:hypothetical protein
LNIYYLDKELGVEYIVYYLDEELGVEYIIYFVDEFHIGSVLVDKETFFLQVLCVCLSVLFHQCFTLYHYQNDKRSKPGEPSDKEIPCRTPTFHADSRVYVAAYQFPGALRKQI